MWLAAGSRTSSQTNRVRDANYNVLRVKTNDAAIFRKKRSSSGRSMVLKIKNRLHPFPKKKKTIVSFFVRFHFLIRVETRFTNPGGRGGFGSSPGGQGQHLFIIIVQSLYA